MSSDLAAVAPDGTLYVLDARECQIYPIAPTGQVGKPFARKGQGPGELNGASCLRWGHGLLAASDGHRFTLFKRDGSVLRTGGVDCGTYISPTIAGAIGGSLLIGSPFAAEKESIWALNPDLDASKRRELFHYPRPPENTTSCAIMSETSVTLNFCPVSDRFFLTGTADGKWVQIYHPQAELIRIIDGATHQQVGVIKLAPGPIAAKAWIDEKLEKQRNVKARARKLTVVPQVPERCPRLRLMKVIGDQLYVVLWSSSPDLEQPVLAYTPDGKPSKPRYSGRAVARLLGFAGKSAWALLDDEEEDVTLPALVPLAQLEKVVAAQPFLEP